MNVVAASSSEDQSQHYSLCVRREPFEYGLLPLPTLISTDLRALRTKLLSSATEHISFYIAPNGDACIGCAGISQALDLSYDDAELVLETLAAVLPGADRFTFDGAPTVCLDDLLLFLYIQNYKKPPLRSHKDAASMEDVWPSNSAFDRLISTLSPLQVRTGRKSFLLQADEEAHQLLFVQKHLPALLSLLADSSGEDDPNSEVLVLERFNHLGFLLKCGGKGPEVMPLSQGIPLFANSDPDMPAAPAPFQQVLDWVQEHLSLAPDQPQARLSENGPDGEADVSMLDACASVLSLSANQSSSSRNQCQEGLMFVDGIMKDSILKKERDINGHSVKVTNCHDSAVYILAPMKYASVYGCSDSIIILGAVEKVVQIEHCERVQLTVSSVRICINSCRECLFYLGVNQKPIILGENHNLQLAPYNTFYPRLEAHLAQVGIDPTVNRWDNFLTLGVVDPHDSLPHAAGVADAEAEGASILPPDRFMNFVIPDWNNEGPSLQPSTKRNPFTLSKAYVVAQQQKSKALDLLRQTLQNAAIDETRRQDLMQALNVHFREWLYVSGNIRQLYEFHDSDSNKIKG